MQSVTNGAADRVIPYNEFKQHLSEGSIQRCTIEEGRIRGWIRGDEETSAIEESSADDQGTPFETVRLEDPDLVRELQDAGVEYRAIPPDPWGALWVWILPVGLIFAWIFLLRSMGGPGTQAATFGKSKARIVPEKSISVNFNDVAGCEEAKSDLKEIVDFLQSPKRFTALGARIPKGVLLVGPPGTGKTLLARAVAGQASVPFFSISGSEFVEMFVGVGAARVRDLFEKAKAKAPCLIFVDELDAIGRQRGVQFGAVNDEREQTLNQLLVELDGFEANSGVILLAATNRPDVLDRALLRPGRFDRQVILDTPDLSGREAILVVHAAGKPMASDVDLQRVARATPGFTGADLANTINEAALLAARRSHQEISAADLDDAIEKVVAGPERKSRRLSEREKRRVAYHEAGHALVAIHSKHPDPVRKISIVPRGKAALGYTLQTPESEAFLQTRSEILTRVQGLLGGRAAEELLAGDVSTGAQNDLERATALIRQMIGVHGMGSRVGLLHCARPDHPRYLTPTGVGWTRDCSEATARAIDQEASELLQEAYEAARELLTAHQEELEALARDLLETETLDRERIDEILSAATNRGSVRDGIC